MPESTTKNLDNLKMLLATLSEDHLGRSEFEQHLEKILEAVIKMQKRNEEEMAMMREVHQKMMQDTASRHSASLNEMSGKLDNLFVGERMSKMEASHEMAMGAIMDKLAMVKDGKDGRDGKSANKEVVVGEVLRKLPKILTTADVEKIVENKLNVSDVKGLEDRLLSERRKGPTVGAVPSQINTLKYMTISAAESANGVITSFTFAQKPQFVIAGGGMMRESGGWTWNGTQAVLDGPPTSGTDVFGIL